jgi:hypothetical protein
MIDDKSAATSEAGIVNPSGEPGFTPVLVGPFLARLMASPAVIQEKKWEIFRPIRCQGRSSCISNCPGKIQTTLL